MTLTHYSYGRGGVGFSERKVHHPVISTTQTLDALPVSVSEVREHLGYGTETDVALDAELTAFIKAAQRAVEHYCQDLRLLTSSVVSNLPELGDQVTLRIRPYASFTSIGYVDEDGNELTVDANTYHVLISNQLRADVFLGQDLEWPSVSYRQDAYRINYVAGWTVETLPEDIKQALLMIVAKFHADRGDCEDSGAQASVYAMKNAGHSPFPSAAAALLQPYKLMELRTI
ncbi:MAG: hypothetical protein RIC14_05645 [Filomicrobium sp.]